LASEGVTDFDRYRADPTQPLQIDFFVPDDMPPPQGVSLAKAGMTVNPFAADLPATRLGG
jgi:hypothetical protein